MAGYDRSQPLIIDPVMDYSSYLGGSNLDQGFAVAVDGTGSAYLTGKTVSTDFPPAGTPFQAACNGCAGSLTDVFIAKVNAAGSALVYTTYLGGTDQNQGAAIKVDGTGNVYLTGLTFSTDFPVTASAFQSTNNGGGDAFMAELNSTGSARVYVTYFGGTCKDEVLGIALDSTNKVYVTGDTCSTITMTAGAFTTARPSTGTVTDAFLAKFDSTLSGAASRVYSTYLGGTASSDQGNAIAVDTSGNAYIAGEMTSSDFPTTGGAFDTACGSDGLCDGGAASDAFVAKLNPAGGGAADLVYSTFLGGGDSDRALGMALDASNNAYVTGVTESVNFPTPVAFQPNSAGGFEAFVTKLNTTGTSLVYSSYLGGNGFDQGNSIAVDAAGHACVAGATGSTDFPLASPVQTSCASCPTSTDAFLAMVNATATALVFSTYLGGIGDDEATGAALDGSANAYIAGSTTSTDFPTIGTPIQATNGGGSDVFVAKVSGLAQPVASLSVPGLDFLSLDVGFTSAPKTVTLTNNGDALLTITSIDTSGDYGETHPTCGATLAAGASCTVDVTFTPTATGPRAGALTITDDAPGSPHTLALSGTGTAPGVSLTPPSVSFPDQLVNTTSGPQTVTLQNTGSSPLTITSIVLASTDFALTTPNPCGALPATLAAGATCTLTVTFTPTTTDVRHGAVTITDNALGSPHVVSLSGTGATPFALATAADTATVLRGVDSTTYTINASSAFGFAGDIALSCSGAESGVCSFSPGSIKPGQSGTLTLSGITGFTSSFLVFTVRGLNGSQAASQTLTLLISDYSVAPTPASATINARQPASCNMTLTPVNGFNQAVSLACTGARRANARTPGRADRFTVCRAGTDGGSVRKALIRTAAPPWDRLSSPAAPGDTPREPLQ